MVTYVAQYELLPFCLKGHPQGSAGVGLPDLSGALDALDPQGWISQILSHLAKRYFDSFLNSARMTRSEQRALIPGPNCRWVWSDTWRGRSLLRSRRVFEIPRSVSPLQLEFPHSKHAPLVCHAPRRSERSRAR